MSKENYHPVSVLNGRLPNGSYTLPGNGYYSVEGIAPRLRFEYSSRINDDKIKYSQSFRIDPYESLYSLKDQGTTLTRYHNRNYAAEQCRDRYTFVPKYVPRSDPAHLHHAGLTKLQQVRLGFSSRLIVAINSNFLNAYSGSKLAEDRSEYRLNKVAELPKVDYNVLPKQDMNDDIYRRYGAKMP